MFSSAKSLRLNICRRGLYVFFMKTMFRRVGSCGKVAMKVNILRSHCTEIYKSVNNINPTYMNGIFKLRKTSRVVRSNYKLNLDVPTINQDTFGDKSLRYYGPKI